MSRETDVSIRPLERGDAAAVQRYASDERVARTTTIPWPYPSNGGEGFVEMSLSARAAGTGFAFAIIADAEMVGVVELNKIDQENRTAQCDYAIASSHWGRGITTRAVTLAVSQAFCDLDLETVNSACLQRNPASGRVLEKNGFTESEVFVYSSSKFKDEPARRFRLTRDEWMGMNQGRRSSARNPRGRSE